MLDPTSNARGRAEGRGGCGQGWSIATNGGRIADNCGQLRENCEKLRVKPTDRPTDRPTDQGPQKAYKKLTKIADPPPPPPALPLLWAGGKPQRPTWEGDTRRCAWSRVTLILRAEGGGRMPFWAAEKLR